MSPQLLKPTVIESVGFVDKGANPEAHIVFWKRDGQESEEDELPPELIEKRIAHRDGEWCVLSDDGKRTLGCHDSREAAMRQLRAVETNKRDGGFVDRIVAKVRSWLEGEADPNPEEIEKGFAEIQEARRLRQFAARIRQMVMDLDAAISQAMNAEDPKAELAQTLQEFQAAIDEAQEAGVEKKADNGGTNMPDQGTERPDVEGLEESVVKYIDDLEARLEKATEGEGGPGGDGDGGGDTPPPEEDVLKGLSPEARKLYEAQQTEIAKLRESQEETAKVAAEERKRRRVAEFTKRAEEDFSHVQGTAAEKAELLMALQDALDEETFEKVEETLTAANEQIRQSQLFRVVGGDGDGTATGSAYAKLKAKAEEVRKADPKLSEARALLEARRTHPELAKEYEREMRAEA